MWARGSLGLVRIWLGCVQVVARLWAKFGQGNTLLCLRACLKTVVAEGRRRIGGPKEAQGFRFLTSVAMRNDVFRRHWTLVIGAAAHRRPCSLAPQTSTTSPTTVLASCL